MITINCPAITVNVTFGADTAAILERLTVNQTELLEALTEVGTNLDEAVTELTDAIGNAGNTSPEVSAKVAALRTVSRQLANIVQTPVEPPAPTPSPAPAPAPTPTPDTGSAGRIS